MGGRSREREISLRSGDAVYRALVERGFEAEAIDIREGDIATQLQSHRFDFAFIALHGTGGEDGEIQSILEKMGIPYLGSDAQASARTFNKITAKKIFLASNIPTPPFEILSASELDPTNLICP